MFRRIQSLIGIMSLCAVAAIGQTGGHIGGMFSKEKQLLEVNYNQALKISNTFGLDPENCAGEPTVIFLKDQDYQQVAALVGKQGLRQIDYNNPVGLANVSSAKLMQGAGFKFASLNTTDGVKAVISVNALNLSDPDSLESLKKCD